MLFSFKQLEHSTAMSIRFSTIYTLTESFTLIGLGRTLASSAMLGALVNVYKGKDKFCRKSNSSVPCLRADNKISLLEEVHH